jgi:aspartate ammonia-lyase
MVSKRIETRVESDPYGHIEIPNDCYWGVGTARAREQLFSCGWKTHGKLLDAFIMLKKAAASVNADLGRLEASVASAIGLACDEVLAGQWHEQFIAEPYQSGAGLSLNVNVNEVLANRAEELLGGSLGQYKLVRPNRHVNCGQAANDLFPTAMRLAILSSLKEFEPILLDLERLLRRKAVEFAKIVTVGRTHLQDSVPITLGQEFNAFGSAIERCQKRIKDCSGCLLEVNIGATFAGTGWDSHPDYVHRMVAKLSAFTQFRLRQGEDLLRMSQSMGDFLHVSSALRELAVELNKIANDLRLLNSGPNAGLAEIALPVLLPLPSSISPALLPDQAAPVLAESLNMICFQILGNDTAVTQACQAGQLQANVMTPVIVHNLLQSLDLLKAGVHAFGQRCLASISVNNDRCRHHLVASGAVFAALCEQIGLERSHTLLEECQGDLDRLLAFLAQEDVVAPEIVEKILSHSYLTVNGVRLPPNATGTG